MDKIYLLAQYDNAFGKYRDYYCVKAKTESKARDNYIMIYGLSRAHVPELRTLGIFMKEDADREYTFLVIDKHMDLDVIYSNKFYDVDHIGMSIEITDDDSRKYFTDMMKLSTKSKPVRRDYLVAKRYSSTVFVDHEVIVATSIDEAAAKYRKNYGSIVDDIQVLGYFEDNNNFKFTLFTMDSMLGKYADEINNIHMKKHLMDDE